MCFVQNNRSLPLAGSGHRQVRAHVRVWHLVQDPLRRTAKRGQGPQTMSGHLPVPGGEGIFSGRRPLCQTHVYLPLARNAGSVHQVKTAITNWL